MFLIAAGLVQAQDVKLPEIIPPSPTVGSLMKFEEVPIDYYTGQPNISIPIFSKKLNKDIGLNLGLRYSTTGVQIDSRSGWVGTGWALETGGVISRTVRGYPDEETRTDRIGVFHNDDYWNYNNLTGEQKNEFNWRASGRNNAYRYDTELDLYQYSLLGSSGRFIIIKQGSSLVPKLLSTNDNVKIILDYNSTSFVINKFTVIDALGNKFTFDQKETSTSIPVNVIVPQSGGSGVIYRSGTSAILTNTSAWHLSKISTSNDIELANFTYSPHFTSYEASRSKTENTLLTNLSHDALVNPYNNGILKPKRIVSVYNIETTTQKPLAINFKDGTSIHFSKSTSNHPETGDALLSNNGAILESITIKDNFNVENKKFLFGYEFTDRLWLDRVSEIGGAETLVYDLTYEDKSNLPAYGTGSDNWGYNDGKFSPGSCTPMSFDTNAIKKGLLTKITYPTGGVKEFEFEQNTFSYQGDQPLAINDYFSFNPLNTINDSESINYNVSNSNHSSSVIGGTITIDFDQVIYVLNTLATSNQEGLDRIFINIGNTHRIRLDELNCSGVFLQAGTYTFAVEAIDYLTTDPFYATGVVNFIYRKKKTNFAREALAGGVRIKEVKFLGENGSKRISYKYNEVNPFLSGGFTDISSGAVDARLGNGGKEYEYSVIKSLFLDPQLILGVHFNRSITHEQLIRYRTKAQGVNAQLVKGGYVGYKYVTKLESNVGQEISSSSTGVVATDNGYTTYTYTTPQDFPSSVAAFTYPFPPSENLEYKRGLLLNQTVFDKENKPLKRIVNSYEYIEESIPDSFKIIDLETCSYSAFYKTYNEYKNTTPTPELVPSCSVSGSNGETTTPCYVSFNCGINPPDLAKFSAHLTSTWSQLKETISEDYLYSSGVLQDTILHRETFEYNLINFQKKETNSYTFKNGIQKHLNTKISYPVNSDLASDFTNAELNTLNGMVGINKINTPVLIKTERDGILISTIKNAYNDIYSNLYELAVIQTSKGSQPLEDRIVYHSYDDHGNPTEVSKKDGTKIYYVWGYQKTQPIAKIEGYTSISSTQLSYINQAIAASNTDTSSCLDSENCNEKTLRDTVTLLRNSFSTAGAQVTSYTYDPLIGVTSITDPRGETIYYIYDAFNRLEFVKDSAGKILSNNQYNYKN